MTADDIVRLLALRPHPEGGHYRETFRAEAPEGARSAVTAIYYLLRGGEESRWHRIDASEIWHWYGGAPLALRIADGAQARSLVLGPDLAAGARPQAVVPALCWQSARSLGAYSLAGCTVAPGFQFSGFEMAPGGWTPG